MNDDHNTHIHNTRHKINAIRSRQQERSQHQSSRINNTITSLLSFVDQNTIRVSLDNPNPIGTQQDEDTLISACRQIAQSERIIETVILDGNAWSNVPVSAGSLDWSRVIDCLIDSFPSVTKLQLSNLPYEKVIYIKHDTHRLQQYKGEKAREPTSMYFESRLVLPILQLLRESVLEELTTFVLKWSPSVVASACFHQGRASLPSVLKFNYTLKHLSIVSCDGGDALAKLLASTLGRANNTLQTLDLSNNNITSKGAEDLARMLALGLAGIREIRLDRNPIGDQGAFYLSRCLPTAAFHFKRLHVDECDIGNDGGLALATMIRLSSGKINKWRPKGKIGGLEELHIPRNSNMNEETRDVLRSLLAMKDSAFNVLDMFVSEKNTSSMLNTTKSVIKDPIKDPESQSKSTANTPRGTSINRSVVLERKEEKEQSHVETSSEKGTYFGSWNEEEGKALATRRERKQEYPLYSLSKLNY